MPNQSNLLAAGGAGATFQERFCQYAQCPADQFAARVLLASVHSDHPLLARLYYRLDKEHYKSDLEMIKMLGQTRQYSDFKQEMQAWRSSHPSKGYLRKTLKLRVSGKNLLRLASHVFKNPFSFGIVARPARLSRKERAARQQAA